MQRISCPELCPDCPYAQMIPEPRTLEDSGNYQIEPEISENRSSASFSFEYGVPTNEHLVEIGLLQEGSSQGIGFWVNGRVGLRGVARAIQSCEKPTEVRKGFMKRKKQLVCSAVEQFAE